MLELWFVIGIFGFIAICAIVATIANIYTAHYNKQFAKKHPAYFELRNAVIEKGNECWEFRNLINQKKKAIDEALAEMPYLTASEAEKVEKQVIEWRLELRDIRDEFRPIELEHITLRDRFNKFHDELVESGEIKEMFLQI
jgi:hypothetical protein